MEKLTIGPIARRAKVNIQTVLYYERRGLLPEPPRRESGYRQYPRDAVARILFIKHAQRLGFSLKEISELLSLRVDPTTTCEDVKIKVEAKIQEIDHKILALLRIKEALARLAAACKGEGPTGECPILEALDKVGGRGAP